MSLQNRLSVLDVDLAFIFIPFYEDPCSRGARRLKQTFVRLSRRKELHVTHVPPMR